MLHPFETHTDVDADALLRALPIRALRLEVCEIWGDCDESSNEVCPENTRGWSILDMYRELGQEDVSRV
jgi:hypothetical protein